VDAEFAFGARKLPGRVELPRVRVVCDPAQKAACAAYSLGDVNGAASIIVFL